MHDKAMEYVKTQVKRFGPFLKVVDLGGRDVNGIPKHLFGNCIYIAVDIVPGPGVIFVGNAADWYHPQGLLFDCVVSTELLEHTPLGPEILKNAYSLLVPNGRLILTTAYTGRIPHSADGSELKQDEYYGNIDELTLRKWIEDAGFEEIEIDILGEDIRAVAAKR